MKSYLKLLLLCALFYAIGQPQIAAETRTVTICDESSTNSDVPFCMHYFKNVGTTTQVIYPKSELGLPSGAKIKSIVFYSTDVQYGIPARYGNANVTVSMKNTTDDVIADLNAMNNNRAAATAVFSGNLPVVENSANLTFDCSDFEYTGDNLIIDTKINSTSVSGSASDLYWYGKSVSTNVSALANYGTTFYTEQFLPKMTITYETSAAPTYSLNGAPVFSSVYEGMSSTDNTNLKLKNLTATALSAANVTIEITGAQAAAFSATAVAVPANGEVAIPVTFSPVKAGTNTATMIVKVNNVQVGNPITLTGTGVAAVSLTGSNSLEFGNVVLDNSVTLTSVTLANASEAAISGTASVASPFSLPNSSFSIPAGATSFVVPVTYAPQTALNHTDILTINAGWSTFEISLSGTGVEQTIDYAALVNPTALNFGSVYTDITTKPTRTVTLTNTGSQAFTPIVVAPANAAYTVSGASGVLNSRDSRTYTITFSPTEATTYASEFHITTSPAEGNLDLTVTLDGEGTEDSSVGITIQPTVVDFGSINAGTTTTRSFTVTNDGAPTDAAITVAAPYSVSQSTMTLATGDNTIEVTFAPNDASSHTATLVLNINGHDYEVTLTGISKKEGVLATRDEAFFSKISYTWTDQNQATHTNNLAEVATDPDQMIAMITKVYTDQTIPGNKYRGYASNGTPNPDEVAYGAVGPVVQTYTAGSGYSYDYDPDQNGYGGYGWNIPPKSGIVSGTDVYSTNTYNLRYFNPNDYKPEVEGVTMLLVEMKDGVTGTNLNAIGRGTYSNERARLRAYFNTMIKSVRVITNAKVIGKDEDRSTGTLFKIDCDKMNRFFMLGKGRLRLWDVASNPDDHHTGISEACRWKQGESESYARFINNNLSETSTSAVYNPFYNMFEQFSPYDLTSMSPVADLYLKLVNGGTFPVFHDCQSVMAIDGGHEFNMYGKTSISDDCQDVRGLMFMVPKYRMTWSENRESTSPENVNGHMKYAGDMYINYYQKDDKDLRPTMGLFTIIQKPITGEYAGESNYTLHLTWESNLASLLPGEDGLFTVYQVITNPDGTETYQPVGQVDENTYNLDVTLPLKEFGYQVTYVIQGQDTDNFLSLQLSNKESYIIPGTNKTEQLELTLNPDHTSRFDPEDQMNYYSNALRVRNHVSGVKETYLTTGATQPQFEFYRTSMVPVKENGDYVIDEDGYPTTQASAPLLVATASVTAKANGEGTLTITPVGATQAPRENFPMGKTSGANGGRAGYHYNPATVSFTYTEGGYVTFNDFVIYDNFCESTAQNGHSSMYEYQVFLNTAEEFESDNQGNKSQRAQSNVLPISIPKTNMEMKGVLTLGDVMRDGVNGNARSEIAEDVDFTIDVKYSPLSGVLRYDAYRWPASEQRFIVNKVEANGDEEDIAPNGFAANQLDYYTLSMNGKALNPSQIAVEQGQTYKAPFVDDYPSTHAGVYTYAPVVEMFNPNLAEYDYYNTYGAPLKSTVRGKVEVKLPDNLGTSEATAFMSTYTWKKYNENTQTVDTYAYYNIPLEFNAVEVPEGYQIYKVRAWRVVDDAENVLGEQLQSRQCRAVADYLYEDMTYLETTDAQGSIIGKERLGNHVLGSRLAGDKFDAFDVDGHDKEHVDADHETVATFGAKRLKTTTIVDGQEVTVGSLDRLTATFYVRIYFTPTANPVVVPSTNNAPRRADGDAPTAADFDYYVAEGMVKFDSDKYKDNGNIITGIDTLVEDRSRDIIGTSYYNPMGQMSNKPFRGVNIIVTRYSDGTTSTSKVIRY